MRHSDHMQSPVLEGNEYVGVINEEIDPPNANRKRKISEGTSVQRKKVLIDSESSGELSEPCCSAATVENVLEDMEEEIDNALEQQCYKDKLTPTNVKSILRHIIANEYVLTMVRNTMKPCEGGELGDIEPKLTRSKAKEMRKKQCSLPWPVASPAKTVQKVSKKLLEEEFPDESSGDEDYKPEEECHSDDEDAVASSKASDAGTPRTRRSLPSSPVSKSAELMSEDENALVIAFPELDVPLDPSEADKIALRTRSKLCLNNTPLEEIEASFIAPDITMDMYDAHCDDENWQSFLCELFKPIDSTGTLDHPDDAENDPEYKVIEDEIPDYEDLRYEQITTDEWNDLMLGTYELAQEDLSFLDDEEEVNVENVVSPSMCVKNVIWMTSDEKLQLDEQLRMYVQLLTQSHLLSNGIPALEILNDSTKIFLEEMKMFASREKASKERSAFYAQNLDGALDIVKKFESIDMPLSFRNVKQSKKHLPLVPPHIKQTLASSKVFIYPELLPRCGFRNNFELSYFFNTPEDNLIALGLEQFNGLRDPVEYIHKYLIPIKSVDRIKTRIKNCKINKKPFANSIKFFHECNEAPKFQRVIRIFDPDNIKAPEDYPLDFLPKWMESYSKLSDTDAVNASNIPLKNAKTSPIAPRKYVPILPRGLYLSPLRYVQPILKKYCQRKPQLPYKPPPLKPKPTVDNLHPEFSLTSSDCKRRHRALSSSSTESLYEPTPVKLKPLGRIRKHHASCSSCSKSPLKPKVKSADSNSESIETNLDISKINITPSGSYAKSPVKPKPKSVDSILESIGETLNNRQRQRAPSTSCTASPYKSPPSEPKTKLVDCNSDSTNRDVADEEIVAESPPSAPIETASLSVDNISCTTKYKKRKETGRAIWVSLSKRSSVKNFRKSSTASSISKAKTKTTKVFGEVDVLTYRESASSVVKTASTKKKHVKNKVCKSSTVTRSSMTTEDFDEEDILTYEESTASVDKTASRRKRKNQLVKKKVHKSSTVAESSMTTEDFEEENILTYEASETSVIKTASTRKGKKQLVKKKVRKSSTVTRLSKAKEDFGEEDILTYEESAASVVEIASTRKGGNQHTTKKHHRDLETSLALLQSPVLKDVPKKEEREVMCANSYLLRATEILKCDLDIYEKFLSTLCKYHQSTRSPVELYSELKEILKDYPALVRDFIVFLRPEQAKECGRYKEHIALSKVREFFRKIEMHFKDQPEHISEILRKFAQLREQVDLTSAELISAIQPLLKNDSHLFEELNEILYSSK